MTTQEQIEFIRQKCIEANPEIMELKFGCGVKWRDEEFTFISGGMAGQYTLFNKRCHAVFASPSECEILGRDIRLADVLLAISKNKKNWHSQEWGVVGVELAEGGHYAHFSSNECGYAEWDLLTDDLTLQSPETIEFIFNLLK